MKRNRLIVIMLLLALGAALCVPAACADDAPDALGGVLDKLGPLLNEGLDGMREGLDEGLDGMREGLGEGLDGIREGLGEGLDGIREGLGDGLGGLTDWLDGKTVHLSPELRETLRDIDTDALWHDLTALAETTKDMDDDALRASVEALAEKHGIHLVDSQVAQLMKLCRTLEKLDKKELAERAEALKDALKDATEDAPQPRPAGGLRGVWQRVRSALRGIGGWLKRTVGRWLR